MNIGNHTMRRSLAASLLLAASTLHAQQLPDPANLTGEHVAPQSPADTLPINHGAPALQQLLLKLRTRASMMLIVAHPDDEDGGLLTYESRGQGARVAMLTLTRGEGGQNLMSSDFDDALGLIRTQELLAADRYLGVDQMFGTEVDFGFSKTIEEAFSKWTHERVLYDAVRAVRLYRPLVLASVFLGAPTDGHGQHQVSGEICQEVFTAAADPKVFPDMIKEGLLPWAPLKVYARVPFSRVGKDGMFDYATGKTIPTRFQNYVSGKVTNIEPVASVQIHEGDPASISFNGQPAQPALGMEGLTYVQFARKGLALQKTQIGLGVRTAPPGRSDTGYTLIASRLCANDASSATPTAQASVSNTPAGNGDSASGVCFRSIPEQSLFAGIDISLPALATLDPGAPRLRETLTELDTRIAEAERLFDPAHLDATALPLREALRTLDTLIASTEKPGLHPTQQFNLLHELRIKRVLLNNALVLALGVTLEPMVKPPHPNYVDPLKTSDRTLYANARITNTGAHPLQLLRLAPASDARTSSTPARPLLPGASIFVESTETYLHPPQATRPYFSRPDSEQPFYNVSDPALRNAPATPYPLVASATLSYEGVPLELRAVIPDANSEQIRTSPAETFAMLKTSYVSQPAVIIPPVTVKLGRASGGLPFLTPQDPREWSHFQTGSSAGILPLNTSTFKVGALLGVKAFEPSILGPATIGPAKIPVKLTAPTGWGISSATYNAKMEPVLEYFTITPNHLKSGESDRLTAAALFDGHAYTETFRPVGYPGLTYTNFYRPATYRVSAVDVTTAPSLHIAFLPGTGDPLPDFLPDLGVTPTFISPKDLTPGSLSQYDAVILGVRAYAAQPTLAGAGSKPLFDYARNGGVVILEYMTAKFGDAEAPYPISVPGDSAHNVVEEAQPVTLPDPAAPLLNWPNKITPADFKGWVSEYGHGFAATWSPQYQPLLEAHDVGQDPQKGGLLLAPVGKGAYIYCALALYRQLPEGVPGAYRLLANLISYAKNPQR